LRVEGFDPYIQLVSDDAADATAMRIKTLDGVGFAVTDDRDHPLMVVRDRGEVGIGTTSPRANLEVHGTVGDYFHVTGPGGDLIMKTDGHVGIGTTSPDAILQVEGTTTDAVARIQGTGDTTLDVFGRGDTVLHVRGAGSNTKLLEVSGTGNFLGNHIAYFNSQGTPFADGIAIRLDNEHTNRENNFVTFLNGRDVVTGRIEGFDLESGDWIAPPPLPDVNFAVNSGVSYDPNWFAPGSLPTVDFSPGQTPSLAFQWDLPSATFHPGTLPALSFNDGSLPTASFSRGTLPTLSFDGGDPPDFDASFCNVGGFSVMCGFSWDDGSTPTASLTGGVRPTLSFSQGSLPVANFTPGALPTLTFDSGSIPAVNWNQGSVPSLTFTGGTLPQVLSSPLVFGQASFTFDLPTQQELDALYCWAFETGNSDYVTLDPVGVAVASLKQSVMKQCKDEGVTYGSKGADYAEWLPKIDPADRFQIGQIVGVIGGKVSLKTEGAEQIMAVSRAPVVVGNVPPEADKHKYVTVGFMGQLPVVVRGKAKAGDYIVPSGLEDGTAVAVCPENLDLTHLGRTLGRAWSDSDNEIYSLVNVAIGLEDHAEKIILEKQRDQIEAQRKWNEAQSRQTSTLAAENIQLRSELAAMQVEMRNVLAMVRKLEDQTRDRDACGQLVAVADVAR